VSVVSESELLFFFVLLDGENSARHISKGIK
jgi:hypothetical protein